MDHSTGRYDALSRAPYAALSTQPIADIDRWKAGWDAHQSARRDAGVLGHLINRPEDDLNAVTVLLLVADLGRTRAFAEAPERRDEMNRYGVLGSPDICWLELLRTAPVWDRPLPAYILKSYVDDVASWLADYDGLAATRQATGIIGHVASRSFDDPKLVVIHHQAESFDALRSVLADPAMRQTAPDAGSVLPEVRFHTSGWAKAYQPQPTTQTRTPSAKEQLP